ncbi:metallophosphoesterase [Deinococcus sp. KNUC1210]|uniref:metallophosphoesterase n=1 Tax=Deinococcus sp. KNUC1210 TaxID=2917691 RepID=UPI001EF08E12|nr:metallophosphoesterase [Deinococcus sp. KNUC1210]ULH16696.1 metallophosphoesterase [Deinococcus sp. KNUC1210]
MGLTLSIRRSALGIFWGTLSLGLGNVYRFRVQQERAALPGLKRPLRAVQMSDFHYGTWIGPVTVRRWVDAALAQQPDVILITGDFLDSSLGLRPTGSLLKELSRLSAQLGVYAVFGNHDWTSLNTQAARSHFARDLGAVGIEVINNCGKQLRDDLFVTGIDDWWFGSQNEQAMLEDYRGGAVLLMSHNPDYLPYVPPAVTLTLSGHTHGGQIRIPLLGPMKKASLYGTRFLEGWVEAAPDQPNDAEPSLPSTPPRRIRGYVTHGLGVTGVPIRLGCPAELTVFEFVPEPQEPLTYDLHDLE